jgi:hypothetical protein
MGVVMLKLYCYKDKKEEYLKWVDKYEKMSIDEKWEEELKFRNKHFSKILRDEKPLTLWQKIKSFMMAYEDELKKEEEEIEWERAFKYFREIDEKIMGDVYERMGLPRNGIRPDDC